MLWSPATSLFRSRVDLVLEAPLCSLNNVHIVQPHRVCRLASLSGVMSHYASASFNKAVISVPICCVLPEDMISGLAIQGNPVTLRRGATLFLLEALASSSHKTAPTHPHGIELSKQLRYKINTYE